MADPKPLKDKVILITGAAQGHGEAVARYVAARGAIVSLSDITGDAVKATAQRIRGEYPESEALGHHVDVCNDDSVRNWVEGVKKQFGRINGCVNNAGVFTPKATPLTTMKPAHWQRVIDVNLTGVFTCLQHQLGAIADDGSIVNVSSGAGLAGLANHGAYVASKHGVVGLTKTAAIEAAPRRIRVNAICPHLMETPMVDQVRVAGLNSLEDVNDTLLPTPLAPEQSAALVSFLLSDEARHITKAAYPIDCGWMRT